jgi:nitrogen-specific signal transduction histidine kinase
MSDFPNNNSAGRIKIILPILILLGVLLFVLTYLGIQKSRSDSLELIRQQGIALIESLTLSSDNAIKANSLFDLLVQEKFSDLAQFIESGKFPNYSADELSDIASQYSVDAIIIFDGEANPRVSGGRGIFVEVELLKEILIPVVDTLLHENSANDIFQLISGRSPSELSMVYIKKVGDYAIVIVSDAVFYSSAKKDIGIGYLVQNIAREVGIEYIIFQTAEGIVFSSRKIGQVLKIETDPFLDNVLNSDTVSSRIYLFNNRKILELVKSFSSVEYQSGVFRLGLSLEKYYAIMAGFDRQMIILSLVIFAVIVLVILYLVGKQKRAVLDRSFRQMKSLSEKIFESINSGVIVVDKDGTVESVNKQFLNIFEADESLFLGKKWEEFTFSGSIPITAVLNGHTTPGDLETIFKSSSGQKNLIINIARLYDHENKEAGAVSLVYDYTAIKELEDTARRKERLTELGDLAAGVAHEIRNPLNAISIAAQRILAEFEPKENAGEFQSMARQIRSEANRLNEIVSKFLSMARGQAGNLEQISLSGIIEQVAELLRPELESREINFVTNIEPNINMAGSADRLKQMIINLIRNGVEACEGKNGQVEIRLKKDGNNIFMSVFDNGPGIPDEIKKKVFSPYFTTKENGTGLGLSIVHQIVEEHKGTIKVITPPDGGTEFRVIFSI